MGWKLVRDGNEAWCHANGVSGTWRKADPKELKTALARKLIEEAIEYAEDNDISELFDVRDVLDALFAMLPAGALHEANIAHERKVADYGYFSDGIMWCPVPNAQGDD